MTIEKILFYGIIIVGAALIIGLTYYRIDWARHPEKYQDLVDQAEKRDRLQGRSLLYGQLLFSA